MLSAITNRQVFERYLTEDEEKRLLNYVRRYADVLARRDYAWMILMRTTGVRVGTCSQLTVGDAKDALRENRLRVRSEIAKGGRGYDVSLRKERSIEALKTLLRVRVDMGYKNGDPDAPLIMSRNHRAMSVRSYQARMVQWTMEAGLQVRASPHWLRHTLAKRVMKESEARDKIAIVQVVLGHRSRESTVLYTLPDREDIDAALDAAQ